MPKEPSDRTPPRPPENVTVHEVPDGDGIPENIRFIGDFELLKEIGRGSMGVVYKARQISLNRVVALKMILSGQFASRESMGRFKREAEVAAELQHPNIVTIYSVGEIDGHAYYVMDYVQGRNLAEMVADMPLPWQTAARYMRKVAAAVDYAHSKGVLHRDLKPQNVLVDEFDEPRILDFGLARKMEDESEFTLSTNAIGSPSYMPPEQAQGFHHLVSPRSDVYGLGAILYEVLTIRPPMMAGTVAKTLEMVVNAEPIPPKRANPSIPDDLNTVCLKCLEKDPARRYGSGEELAEELDRVIEDRPIKAKPIGPITHGLRWCRRNKAVTALAASIILLLVASSVISTTLWVQTQLALEEAKRQEKAADEARMAALQEKEIAEEERKKAEAAREDAEYKAFIARRNYDQLQEARRQVMAAVQEQDQLEQKLAEESTRTEQITQAAEELAQRAGLQNVPPGLLKAMNLLDEGRNAEALAQLGTYLEENPGDSAAAARALRLLTEISWAKPLYPPLEHTHPVIKVAMSDDGQRFLTVTEDNEVFVYDSASGEKVGGATAPQKIAQVIISPAGKHVAMVLEENLDVVIWSPDEDRQFQAGRLYLSESAKAAIAAARAEEVVSGQITVLDADIRARALEQIVDFSDDGQRLVLLAKRRETGSAEIQVVDLSRREVVWERSLGEASSNEVPSNLAFHPSGNAFLTTSLSSSAFFPLNSESAGWQLPLQSAESSSDLLLSPAAGFSRDGNRFFILNHGKTATGDARSGRFFDESPVPGGLENAGFTADGSVALGIDQEGMIYLWSVATGERIGSPHKTDPGTIGTPNLGDAFLYISPEEGVCRFDSVRRESCVRFPLSVSTAVQPQLTPSSSVAVTLNGNRNYVTAWRAIPSRGTAVILPHGRGLEKATFSADGSRVMTTSQDGAMMVWDTRSGKRLAVSKPVGSEILHAQFDASGQALLAGTEDGRILRWAGEEELTELLQGSAGISAMAFDPENEFVVVSLKNSLTSYVISYPEGRRLVELESPAPMQTLLPTTNATEEDDADEATRPRRRTGQGPDDPPRRPLRPVQRVVVDQLQERLPEQLRFPGNMDFDRMVFSVDGRYLALISPLMVNVWELNDLEADQGAELVLQHFLPDRNSDGQELLAELTDLAGNPFALRVQAAGKRVLNPQGTDDVKVVDTVLRRFSSQVEVDGILAGSAYDGRGELLATLVGNVARLWRNDGGAETQQLVHPAKLVSAVFDPSGSRLATTTMDGRVFVWDTKYGMQMGEALEHEGRVTDVRFSQDGQWLLTASEDGVARLHEALWPVEGAPSWLPKLAQVAAGSAGSAGDESIEAEGKLLQEPALYEARQELQSQLARLTGGEADTAGLAGTMTGWFAWFLAEPMARGVNSSSTMTGDEYAERAMATRLLSLLLEGRELGGKMKMGMAGELLRTPQPWVTFALAMEKLGRLDEALESIALAKALEPENREFLAIQQRLKSQAAEG